MLWARKIIYRTYRLSSSLRYRIRRRYTRAGLAMLGGVTVSATLSLNIGASLSYQILALLVCLLAVAFVGTWKFRGKFTGWRLLPRFGTVGTPLGYRVVLRNDTGQPQSDLMLLENMADPRPQFAEYVELQKAEEKRVRSFSVARRLARRSFEFARIQERRLPALAPGQEAEVRLELTPLRRGCLRFTGLTVGRPDPLGLMKAFVRLPLPQSLLILPKRYPLPPVALPGSMKYQQGGVALASSVGQSEEFVSLRDYRNGDPLRHIHWRSWAKTGKPIVKEFQDEFYVRHALILDTFTDHPHSAVFEEAVSVAASFACTIQTQESLLDLLFVGPEAYCFTSGRGLAHREQMLEILAAVEPCREPRLAALEGLVLGHVSLVSGCICVLLDWDEPRQQLVQKLRQAGVPVLVLVITGPNEGKTLVTGPLDDEPGQFQVLEVGKIEEGLARLE